MHGADPVNPPPGPGASEERRTEGTGRVHGGSGYGPGKGGCEGDVAAYGYRRRLPHGAHVGGHRGDDEHQE